jgi:hypothetical protein
MFLRLMLLVPLIRQFMLLDVEIMPDGSEHFFESPYKQLDAVEAAAARAVARLNQDDRRGWKRQGVLRKVCRRYGPHSRRWCWLHRRRVNTVMIPDMERGYWAARYFYLGADGRVYRDGLNKIYRAELHKRRRPRDIKAVARKLDRICPMQDQDL